MARAHGRARAVAVLPRRPWPKIEELRTSCADKTATGFFLSRVEDVIFLFFFGCWIVLCAHVFISVIMSDDSS